MITLRQYQEDAVRDLCAKSVALLDKRATKSYSIVFQSPTGSGKTVMMQECLRRLSEIPGKRLCFVWLSVGDIAAQSKRSFVKNLEGSRLRFSELADVRDRELAQNEILFVNWEKLNKKSRSGEWKVRAMRDNESEENLPAYLSNAREAGREIVLVVDESHRNLGSDRAQEIIAEFVKPRLQIEVSATPDSRNPDEKVSVEPEDVIEAGMIRREALMNERIGIFAESSEGSDTVLLEAAIAKRNELAEAFSETGTGVKPLILVQLPNDGEKASDLDRTKLDHAERILAERFGITRENGKLAVWLSDDKTDNLEGVEAWNSPVEVLVFKQAIAIGWDCPRAQILVMFREIKSFAFSIQVIGRVLRTPEQKHYGNPLLDSAYVYTDLPRAQLRVDENVRQYFKTKTANRVPDWNGFAEPFPTKRATRTDYGDVGLSFYAVLAREAVASVGGESGDRAGNLAKLGGFVDTGVERLSEDLLSDGRIALDVDERTERVIESALDVRTYSEAERTQLAFDDFLRRNVRPHFGNVARSYPTMKESLYSALEREFFGKGVSRAKLQAVVLSGRAFFEGVLDRAKAAYLPVRAREISEKTVVKPGFWNVPAALEFPESAEMGNFRRYAFEPAWIAYDSEAERRFVRDFLENPTIPVKRWYRNGDASERYFSVPYESDGKLRNFYPDFLAEFEDGSVGAYDPKDGITLAEADAKPKLDALSGYLSDLRSVGWAGGRKISGGFVTDFGGKADWMLAEDSGYLPDGAEGWGRFSFTSP